jgi:hypothetical protein
MTTIDPSRPAATAILARRMGGAQRYPSRFSMLAYRHERRSSQLHCRGPFLRHRQMSRITREILASGHKAAQQGDGFRKRSTHPTGYDLSGAFNNASLHGGAGLGGSVDYFVGNSPNGPVFGGGVTLGPSAGGSVAASRTTTQVCGSQGCAGTFSDVLPSFTAPATAATSGPASSLTSLQTTVPGTGPTQLGTSK